MGRTVLLRHDLPDGSGHFDWLIERLGGGGLITFRVFERIDEATVREFRAERLADHREAYLEYQGPVSGGRGTVKRVAEGVLEVDQDMEASFDCHGFLGSRKVRFLGRQERGIWRFLADSEP